jgi:uncharacterized membrane protein YhhN
MKRVWFIFFLLVSMSELAALMLEWEVIHRIAKPLILIALIAYFMSSATKRNTTIMGALLFCWAGDVLLMFQGDPLFFMLGLVAFLIGHLFYIISYHRMKWKSGEGLINAQKLRFSLPIVLAGTGLVTILFPYLNDLKIPVTIYALVLTVMVLQALYRFGFTGRKSFTLIFTGALLFMISDSALAINKFMQPLPAASFIIMITYISAQFLIVEGVIEHINHQPVDRS